VKPDEIWKRYPRLYHMAAANCWKGISKNGLLSTSALLDLFEYKGSERNVIESCHRPECVEIEHRTYGKASVRDQKPMSDGGLKRCLTGLSPKQWYRILNRMVFFWLTEDRLETMLNAKAYRNIEQDVLVVDSESLVIAYEREIRLSPINSGCTKPWPQPRDRSTFLAINKYPYDFWVKKRGRSNDPIVELAVWCGVPDVKKHVIRVERRRANRILRVLWSRRR
jgi:hypothetical protein